MSNDRLSICGIAARGTIIATVIVIPSLVAFALTWAVSESLTQAIILGAVIHFVAMGFSSKISRKILWRK